MKTIKQRVFAFVLLKAVLVFNTILSGCTDHIFESVARVDRFPEFSGKHETVVTYYPHLLVIATREPRDTIESVIRLTGGVDVSDRFLTSRRRYVVYYSNAALISEAINRLYPLCRLTDDSIRYQEMQTGIVAEFEGKPGMPLALMHGFTFRLHDSVKMPFLSVDSLVRHIGGEWIDKVERDSAKYTLPQMEFEFYRVYCQSNIGLKILELVDEFDRHPAILEAYQSFEAINLHPIPTMVRYLGTGSK